MEEKKTVWCGNLADKVTEELLQELFLQAAPLERVHIPSDKEGRKSNFAFISFKHEVSVKYVTELLNGTYLFNKPINIKPRCRNPTNENQPNFKDRREDFQRRNEPEHFNEHVAPKHLFFDNLMQMGQMMNPSIVQPIYSSSIDRRLNDYMDPRNNRNFHRDERKPYSRNHQRYNNRNHNRYDRQRHC